MARKWSANDWELDRRSSRNSVRVVGVWLGYVTRVVHEAGAFQLWHTHAYKGFERQGVQGSKPGTYYLVEVYTEPLMGKMFAHKVLCKETTVQNWRELRKEMIALCEKLGTDCPEIGASEGLTSL